MSAAIRCDRCTAIVERNGIYASLDMTFSKDGEEAPLRRIALDLCERCSGHVYRVVDARPLEPSR